MGGVDSRDGAAIVVVILFVCCFFTSVRTGSEVVFFGRLSDFGAEWVTWDDNLSIGKKFRIMWESHNMLVRNIGTNPELVQRHNRIG